MSYVTETDRVNKTAIVPMPDQPSSHRKLDVVRVGRNYKTATLSRKLCLGHDRTIPPDQVVHKWIEIGVRRRVPNQFSVGSAAVQTRCQVSFIGRERVERQSAEEGRFGS